VQYAYSLLETTTLSVDENGRHAGFSSGSYFIQLFRKSAEMTLLQYRQQFEQISKHSFGLQKVALLRLNIYN
jgi:AraC-like DNA-binding protein